MPVYGILGLYQPPLRLFDRGGDRSRYLYIPQGTIAERSKEHAAAGQKIDRTA